MKQSTSRWTRWVPAQVAGVLLLGVMLFWLPTAMGARAKTKKAPPKPSSTSSAPAEDDYEGVESVDVGTRDVLERLKLLRVQMALDREEISALQLRIAKIKLEREFEALLSAGTGTKTRTRKPSNPASDILVKAITLQPRKEAVIMYRGRLFTVRPGDKIGGLVIRDIDESGLKVKGAGKGKESVVR